MNKEIIEVLHFTGDEINTDENEKRFDYEFNGYTVYVTIGGDGNYFKGVRVEITDSIKDEGFEICTRMKNGKMILWLDAYGGRAATQERSHHEWIKLDRLEKAIKLIGSFIK